MNVIKDKDKTIQQKELELQKLMQEYYQFDMSELKQEIDRLLTFEQSKISQEKDIKIQEIQNNFKRIMTLAQDHIAKGSAYKIEEIDEQRSIEEFERQSEEYEKVVREANTQKQQLRQEIAQMEIELRKLRDQVADRQIENKNLGYLVQREEELKKQKNEFERKALKTLSQDLEEQLDVLQNNAEKITGKVTPYGMELVLQEKFKRTSQNYQKFIQESERDLQETQKEVDQVRKELEKERMITSSLQHEVDLNEGELAHLQEQFKKHKGDLDEMNFQHEQKLKELEQIRIRANEEIKQLSIELGISQSEINVLILESQKYESQLEFLAAEREMILKAQLEAEEIDPLYQSQDLQEAEEKRRAIEEEIMQMNKEWFGKLEKVREETERALTDNEMKEFRARIAILSAELNEKNKQIEQINKDKMDLEKLADKAMSMGMQITEQSEEISELNEKYKSALRDKVQVYDELVESLKELVNRNSRFMKNEIEICRLINETAVLKRELEQKEKFVEDMAKELKQKTIDEKEIQEKAQKRIQEKQLMLRQIRQEIRDQDAELEFFEFLLIEKQRNINQIQDQIEEQSRPKGIEVQVQKGKQNQQTIQSQKRAKDQIDPLKGNKKNLNQQIQKLEEERKTEEEQSQAKTKKSTSQRRR